MIKGYAAMGLAALVCIAVIVAARNWGCRQPRPPRPPKVESFDVISVPTGNSIIVKAGRRDRTITVTLKGIGVPNLPGAQEAARANLERLAGKKIKAEIPRRRLSPLRMNEDGSISCPVEHVTEPPTDNINEFMEWFEKHCPACEPCSFVPTRENPEPLLCEEATCRLFEVVGARSDFTSPQAWGETGLCLQLEQLRGGYAISVGDVPKTWAKAEKAAKKAGRGIWK